MNLYIPTLNGGEKDTVQGECKTYTFNDIATESIAHHNVSGIYEYIFII